MNDNEIIIRHAEPDDIAGMWPIIESDSDRNERLFIKRVAEKRLLSDHFIPVARLRSEVLGYAWVHDYGPHIRVGHRTARLNDLFVSERHRRSGIGRLLFMAVTSWCEARNVRWLQWQSSEKAIQVLRKLRAQGRAVSGSRSSVF
ncbi:GNAT family N-acetyltransferase [Paenibacillus sp. GYB003]|uniref:GNAT family N-acetyltransferase n=1 Tax=Paenibacillus sp. GYB003 TaxID=2994392 RepID=UPI002F96A1B5